MKRAPANHFVAATATETAQQNAALCWRLHRGRVQVLLITSRDTGRWVLPKGWPMAGKTAAESAAIEAWEEAGVTGAVAPGAPIGLYRYDKNRSPIDALPCVVTVHPLRVNGLADKFPERKQRRRKWFDATKAAQKVAEPDLSRLLEQLRASEDGILLAAQENTCVENDA